MNRHHAILVLSSLACLVASLLSGCVENILPDDWCNPLTHKAAQVQFAGTPRLAVGAPVLLEGAAIGRVAEVTAGNATDKSGTPGARVRLCLLKEAIPRLKRTTIFYVDAASPQAGPLSGLVCEPVAQSGEVDPSQQELLFPGFLSQEDYLAWRAGSLVQQGVREGLGQLLQGLETMLQGLPKPAPGQ